METKVIIEAEREGYAEKLHNLTNNGHFILRAMALSSEDTPLHIACIGGHIDLVKEILNLRPQFAAELNKDGFTPLHIAAASGDTEIVKELLKVVDCNLCLAKGKEKRIPLHYAVARGRIEIMRELLSACSDSIREVTVRGESCFHVAVKNSQFEAFKVLVEYVVMYEKEEVLNKKDGQGNTILHLAASRKQYEVFDLLLNKNLGRKCKLDTNSPNKKGLTPLDVLASKERDTEIHEMLIRLASAEENPPHVFRNSLDNQLGPEQRTTEQSRAASKALRDYFKHHIKIKEPPSRARDMLLVIAVLIATATYQAVLSPPGGVWQDDYWPEDSNRPATEPPHHTAGKTVMGTHSLVYYCLFLFLNSLGFYMSMHMMNFLAVGLTPLQFQLRMAVAALSGTYGICMVAITPSGPICVFFVVLAIVMPLLMPLLTLGCMVRDLKKNLRKIRRAYESSASNRV